MNINSNNPSNLLDFTPLTLQPSTSSHLAPLTEQPEAPTLLPPRPASRTHNIARLNRALPANLNFQKVLDQLPWEAGDDYAFKFAAHSEVHTAATATSGQRVQWNDGLTVGLLRIPISVTTSQGKENAIACGTFQCESDKVLRHETATLTALAVAAPSSGKLYLLGEYMPSKALNRDYTVLESRSDLTHLVNKVLDSLDAEYPLTLNLLPDATAQHEWIHDQDGVHETRAMVVFNSDGKLLGLAIHPRYADEPMILGQAPTMTTQPTVDKGKGVDTTAQGERSPAPDGYGHERWQILPDQYRELDLMNNVQDVAGSARASTSRSQTASSSTSIIPLREVPDGIRAWLDARENDGTVLRSDAYRFIAFSRFIETTGISLEDLRLDKELPFSLSRQTRELLYVSLVAQRDTQLPNARAQAVYAVPSDDRDLDDKIREFVYHDRLRLPPHLLAALPPFVLRNAVVQAWRNDLNLTYDSLDPKGRKDVSPNCTCTSKVMALVSRKVLEPYGERAKPMYGAGISPKAPVGYRPTHPLHLAFYNRYSGTMTRKKPDQTQVVPSALTSRMKAVFSALEGGMGAFDRSKLEEETHTVASLTSLVKSLGLKLSMKDKDLKTLINKLVEDLPGDVKTYRNSQQSSPLEEAGAPAIAGRTRPASGSPEGRSSMSRQRIESPSQDAENA